jgi:hypothetical protein
MSNSRLKIKNRELVAYSKPKLEQELKSLVRRVEGINMKAFLVTREAMVELETDTIRVIVATDGQEAYDYWMELERIGK